MDKLNADMGAALSAAAEERGRGRSASARECMSSPQNEPPRRPLALPGKVRVSIVALRVLAAALLLSCGHPKEMAHYPHYCKGNLKVISCALNMYADRSRGGLFPPVSFEPGIWAIRSETICPKYLGDSECLRCPDVPTIAVESADRVPLASDIGLLRNDAARKYVYLGWVVLCDEDVVALAEARKTMTPEDYDKDIRLPGRTLFRLKQGAERFLITDINDPNSTVRAQSTIPVVFDASRCNHRPVGKNVLFLDGHVEFVRYGTFPCTDTIDKVLGVLTDCDDAALYSHGSPRE